MVSIALAGMLSAGLFYMMAGQQRTYQSQFKVMGNYTNLRGAISFLEREIQRGGFGLNGCPSGRIRQWDPVLGGNNVRDASIIAVAVYNNCNLVTTDPAACPDGSGSDSFTVSYTTELARGSVAGTRLLSNFATTVFGAPSSELNIADGHNFQDNDFVVVWQTASSTQPCTLLRVTDIQDHVGAPGGDDLIYAADGVYNPPATANILAGGGYLSTGTIAVRFGPNSGPRHFAIDTRTDPPRLVTWRTYALNPSTDLNNGTFEPVADRIEDMQLSAACDMDNDKMLYEGHTPAFQTADEWSDNTPGDTPPACGTRPIRAVRVTLIARSDGPILGNRKGFRPAAEDRAAGTSLQDLTATGDMGTYARSTLTSTVAVVNLR